ncbi:MAG: protein kinase, partial [Planctomycetes bacterium]|nr:protein kinase [Planctomycetota bacterium]
LEHPNIIRTYQVGQVPETGLSYIAMELVQGPSLSQILEQAPTLDTAHAAALLEPIARALAYAHARGVIHRDVKPSNILFQTVGTDTPLGVAAPEGGYLAPLLSDFGIARALDAPELTSEGRTIGTPAFMSPEQCLGSDELDGRTDVYSLGAVLYRCLVGRPPFAGSTTQILHSHVYDELTIPGDALRELPPRAIEILRKSMAKSPADRYETAGELARDLASLYVEDSSGAPVATTQADDETVELPPSAPRQSDTSSLYVLVPARQSATQESGTSASVPSAFPPGSAPRRTTQSTAATRPAHMAEGGASGRRRRQPSRFGLMLLAIALVALVAMLAVTVMYSVLPAIGFRGGGTPASTESVVSTTSTSVASDQTDSAVSGAKDAESQSGSADTDGNAGDSESGTEQDASAANATAQAQASGTPESDSLQVSPEFAWKSATELYDEQDWEGARDWLIAVRRSDPNYEADAVAEMLADTDSQLAAVELQAGDLDAALQLLDEAHMAAGNTPTYIALYDTVQTLADASGDDEEGAIVDLQIALASYAEVLAEQERYCDALAQIDAALAFGAGDQLQEMRDTYAPDCDTKKLTASLPPVAGRVLYSAVESDAYGIYETVIGSGGPGRLVVDSASQPALNPDGSAIAFFSRRPDVQGLVKAALSGGNLANDERVKLSEFAEDTRDSAPSWNPQGDRVVYASTSFGDGRSRIYVALADGSRDVTELGLGKDPVWHPNQDLIVFNGTDEGGNNPGLWMMRTDGSGRVQLTDNGNDQRPVWLPDGSGIVFMSNGRDGNWEMYLLDTIGRHVTRLTDNPAQDGLPTISPDGQFVGFMSDRNGYWSMWYVPLIGGDSLPLSEIGQELPQWLEHSMEWLNP